MMDNACATLTLQNPTLQFFFKKEALCDDSGEYTCIARNIAYFVATFSCRTISESFALLRESWHTVLRERSYPVLYKKRVCARNGGTEALMSET